MLLSEELVKEYAENFRGKSFEELNELAKSFKFCKPSYGVSYLLKLIGMVLKLIALRGRG